MAESSTPPGAPSVHPLASVGRPSDGGTLGRPIGNEAEAGGGPVWPLGPDQRKQPRRQVTSIVRYRRIDPRDLSGGDQRYLDGTCRNISEGGMFIEVDRFVTPGQVLEVYVDDRGAGTTIFGIVETVRLVHQPDRYEIGVRYLKREEI